MPAPGLRAQEAKDGAKAEPAAEAKEAPAAAPAADAPAAPAEASKKSQRNLLQWAIDASGPIGLFLLCLSVYFVALIIKLFLELRVSEAVPADLVEKLEVAIKDKKFQEAYDACKDNDSFLARLVRTGVANLPNGRAEAKEAMAAVQDEVVTMMETRISYLAIIGTLGPMIGLVGTIAGMIASFQEIANAVGAQPRPDKVAEGISTALFITLEGVSLSVPGDLLLRLLPQPDRPDHARDGQGRRPDDHLAAQRRQAGQDRLRGARRERRGGERCPRRCNRV